jgi:hypothetical protein
MPSAGATARARDADLDQLAVEPAKALRAVPTPRDEAWIAVPPRGVDHDEGVRLPLAGAGRDELVIQLGRGADATPCAEGPADGTLGRETAALVRRIFHL